MTREDWLNKAVKAMRESLFRNAGYDVPENVRASIGFPSVRALSAKGRAIGQAWSPECSLDGTHELFVSPVLDESVRVLDVLAHELVHATVGVKEKHGKIFKACARAIGLEGKATATVAGEAFKAWAEPWIADHGAYPASRIDPVAMAKEKKTQKTYMLKLECPACGYQVRTTQKWVDLGLPLCPLGHGDLLPEGADRPDDGDNDGE